MIPDRPDTAPDGAPEKCDHHWFAFWLRRGYTATCSVCGATESPPVKLVTGGLLGRAAEEKNEPGGLYVAVRSPSPTWFAYMGDLAESERVRIAASVEESLSALGFVRAENPDRRSTTAVPSPESAPGGAAGGHSQTIRQCVGELALAYDSEKPAIASRLLAALVALEAREGELEALLGGEQSSPSRPVRDQSHYGHTRSFPPYVGGDDDDEAEGWQAYCMCGWQGRQTEYVTVAHLELIAHLNEALTGRSE